MMRPLFGKIEALGPWTAHIQAMDQAVAENDPGEAVRAWRQAYSAALSHPGWLGLLTVAAASLRLGAFPGLARGAAARARETYWIAFFRARQQRSLNGVLHAAEAFGVLGDSVAHPDATIAIPSALNVSVCRIASHCTPTVRRGAPHRPDEGRPRGRAGAKST